MTDAAPVGLMRNIGRFVGHIVSGVQSSPTKSARQEVSRSIEQETRPDGVILRRTVIEEVEVPAPSAESSNEQNSNDHAP